MSWGRNADGQLGDGTTNPSSVPVAATGLTDVKRVSAGCDHSLALMKDGTVMAWGDNSNGELGDGTTDQNETPALVPGLNKVSAVSAGCDYSMALKENGTLRAWGLNDIGQLGDGSKVQKESPVVIDAVDNVKQVVASGASTAVLLDNGTVKAWGGNILGQLGNGTFMKSLTPVKVKNLANVKQISTGSNGYHVLALLENGTVKVWGYGLEGQLGDGSFRERVNQPVKVFGLKDVKAVAGGEYQSLALMKDGTVRSWGEQDGLGNGSEQHYAEHYAVPTKVKNLTNVVALASGHRHSLALKENGTVMAWGLNTDGALGDGTVDYRGTPVAVDSLTGVKSISAGTFFSLASK